jgi:fumarate reductase subunit D
VTGHLTERVTGRLTGRMTDRLTWRAVKHRGSALWIAAMLHRISGLTLAIFLPLHFLALGLALEGEARLDSFLRWSERPLVKVSEIVLMFLFTVHLLGGLRILVIENFAWRDGQKQLATLAAVVSAIVALAFLLRVF